jgi:hypothetical protein
MKKLLGCLKGLWKLLDGRKRDIALLFTQTYTTALAAWHIGAGHWLYATCATIAAILTALGFGHAAAKGDLFKGNGGTP